VSASVTTHTHNDPAAAAPSAAQAKETSPAERRPGTPGTPDLEQQGRLDRQSQLFRDLMAGRMTAWQLAELASRGGSAAVIPPVLQSSDQQPGFADDPRHTNVDVAALMAAEKRVDAGPPAHTIAATASPDRAFAELIEKHVRRVLASREARGSHGGEVRIELSDAVLPGTALLLKRTSAGWQLSATSENRQSLDMLEQFAPALVERFARASLGRLEVSLDRR
jgi:hypothetical protein